MRFLHKKRLVIFLKKYTTAKNKAKNLMSTGDLNSYLKQLIETEKSKKAALTLLSKNS